MIEVVSHESDFRVRVLLSMLRALWGIVTPDLRGVSIRAVCPKIEARFIYEIDPCEESLEDVAAAESEVCADFCADEEIMFTATCVPPSVSLVLDPEEEWVFLRKETRVG